MLSDSREGITRLILLLCIIGEFHTECKRRKNVQQKNIYHCTNVFYVKQIIVKILINSFLLNIDEEIYLL